MPDTLYEVYAIQYARSMRPSSDLFLGDDPHNGPYPLVYYIWVLRGNERTIVVDTGFNEERARERKRDFIRCPTDGLRAIGIEPEDVDTVVVTHLHYDHAGNLDKFPHAVFVLQDEEMRYATGRSMRFKPLRHPFELGDVLAMVTHNYAGRVRFVSGTRDIAPGVSVHHVPGHTKGLQAVTVETARGRVCLASDAAHYYANIALDSPFPTITDVASTLEGHDAVVALAQSPDHLIPGHDPAVAELFPTHADDDLTFDLAKAPKSPCPIEDRWSPRRSR